MLSLLNRSKIPKLGFAAILLAFTLISPSLSPAQERYPTVARISFVSGPVTYSRGDDPDEWDDAIENVPLTIGDRIYSPEGGQAELQISSGNFIRLAPRSYFSALNLSDDIKQFYLGEGAASFNVRRLASDEVIEIDTPNVSVTLDQPGRYRIAVDEDGNSRISVRRGRAVVAASGRQITVENREIRVYGIDSPRYDIVALPATDAFDRWVAERDDRFERSYPGASRYASDEIIGVEDLSEYGRWEDIPEYGYAWTPSRVAAGWVPFSDGRWFWQDPWGWTWISNDRWGWATSHYGRWTPYRSRWYWVPVRPRTRVRYVPAVVEFVRVRDHVGWFPLHPRDRFVPWWEGRDRQRNDRNITYVNRTYVTIVNQNTFISTRPVNRYIVRDSVVLREARSAHMTEPLPIPSRSSLRLVSETGERRNQRPSANILARAAVVRTAPPAAPPTFQEKLPEIQKTQGRPIAPSTALTLSSQNDKTKTSRVRIRPAAVETSDADFAPRTPGTASGPNPQPLTAARGKKLATRENSVDTKVSERTERGEKSASQQQPLQPAPAESSKGIAGRPEAQRPEQDRNRQRQEKQTLERERQAQQQQQQDLERKQQEQQKEQERKSQLQQKQQDQERREQQRQQQLQERQAQQQQKQQELERKQQQQQREQQRETQLQQKQQDQERREQLRQQQLQERQAQQQQEQARREQLKQQQVQERQAREQQRQQDLERRQQREQDRNAQVQRQEQARAQQLRQQQAQEQRQAQQQQRQQQPQRRQPEPQKEERKVPPPLP
jgi:hypothetical protein